MKSFIVLLAIFYSFSLISQSNWIAEDASSLSTVPLIEMPRQDNGKLQASARSAATKNGPRVFAEPLATNLQTKHGSWQELRDNTWLWRIRIRSEQAYSLNLGFKNFNLPGSAKLFIYDRAKTYVIGPVRAEDNDIHLEWWSPIMPFDEVIVEVQVAEQDRQKLDFIVDQVNHDFNGLGSLLSGSCNVDVVCSAQDGFPFLDAYRDIMNSVGLISVQGFRVCSGFLMNNVRNDCTPYLMTAYHCEITPTNMASVVVYWNYQNTTCRMPGSAESGGPGDGNLQQFNSGASIVAGDENLDFLLLELDDEVDPAYDVFYAGWDVENETFDTTLCVHHPDTEEKRVSVDFDPPQFLTESIFVRVLDWDLGTTEGGSSGSPLFSDDKYAIGFLSEGLASCQNDLLDDFAKLKLAWDGAGTPQSRLKDWLDPDNTGIRILDGRSCTQAIAIDRQSISLCAALDSTVSILVWIQSGFDNGVRLSLPEISQSLHYSFSDSIIVPGDTVLLSLVLGDNFQDPLTQFMIKGADSLNSSMANVTLETTFSLPDVPIPSSPQEAVVLLEKDVQLEWSGSGEEFTIEVYEDTTLAPILVASNVEGNTFGIKSLDPVKTYFWRLQAINPCGTSPYSAFASFYIADINCLLTQSDHTPIQILTDLNTIESQVVIVDLQGIITDVNVVDLRGRHTYISDLQIQLKSPSGTIANLVVNPCFDEDDFFASFDDESDVQVLDCPFNRGQVYRPADPLSVFDGETAIGAWTLIVDDQVQEDGGTLLSWGLEICVNNSEFRTLQFQPNTLSICPKIPQESSINAILSAKFNGPVNFSAQDENGNPVELKNDSLRASALDTVTLSFHVGDIPDSSTFLRILTSDAEEVDTFTLPLFIVGQPSVAVPMMPVNGSQEVDRETSFTWSVMDDVDRSRFILYGNPDLTEIVFDTTVKSTTLILPFRLEKNTTYYWQVITVGECADSFSQVNSFTTEISISTSDIGIDGIRIYPNPAKDLFTIENSTSQAGRMVIVDLLGREYISQQVNHENILVKTDGLPEGVYVVRLFVDNHVFTEKVIVSR